MPTADAEQVTRVGLAANRSFYDEIWSGSYVVPPERFNTWPLLSALASEASARLEIGPGLRPRLPIAGTSFADVSQPALLQLKARGGHTTLADVAALPYPDDTFDLICAFDIIEHVESGEQVFRELGRVARDDATLVFSVPLHAARWTPFDTLVGHVRRYEPDELLATLAEHAFEIAQSAGFGMAPRSRWLLAFAVWGLTHHREHAMRWYNRMFLPIGLRLQKHLAWTPGLIDVAGVDELLLVCGRGG